MTNRLTGSMLTNAECAAALSLWVKAMCLTALILSVPAITAAEAGEESESANPANNEQRSQDNTTQTPANASGSQKRNAGDKGGVFLPTEDISEDVAITFPVDI